MERESKAERIIHFYESIDSTNAQAAKEAKNGAKHGTLFVADMQTAGRGRRGRAWDSPAGSNIYFSLLLRPELVPDKASMLTLVMALAVAEGIERTTDRMAEAVCGEDSGAESDAHTISLHPQIKWPNDIVVNGKKVCGILTEMNLQSGKIDSVIIGVGINVHKQEFAPELVDKATCLDAECGQKISRSQLRAEIIEAFEEYYAAFMKQGDLSGLRENYQERLVNLGREVRVLDPQGEYMGIATGITDTGELCVQLPDGSIRQVYAGEVSVRGIYGYV